jgi:hypothetical protein
MKYKTGDRITTKTFCMSMTMVLGKGVTKPVAREDIREVVVVCPASKLPEFQGSDWIVCLPKDYPISDLRCHSHMKFWGINNYQII